MIVVTGDTHGDFRRFSSKKTKDLFGADDYIIVAGDFGLVWADDKEFQYWRYILANKKFTTLFIDGNHENFDMLNSYKVEEWHGGKVHHIVQDKVIHLMRGQVFEIEGHKIFTFGGAASHDIQGGILNPSDEDYRSQVIIANKIGLPYRVLGLSWWEQEMPSDEELEEGRRNLEAHNWQVDYVITHSICNSRLPDVQAELGIELRPDKLTTYFEELESKLQYKKWLTGHYHIDKTLDNKHIALYNQIRQLR